MRFAMDVICPIDFFRWLGRLDVQIDNDRFLAAPDKNAAKRLFSVRIDLLMRNERRNIDEIARTGLRYELKIFSPAHSRPPAYNVNNAFQVPMMMRARFRIGSNCYGSGPKLFGAGSRIRDCRGPIHTGCLGRVAVELVATDYLDAMLAPILFWIFFRHVIPLSTAAGS
jgi:hypothetical protein